MESRPRKTLVLDPVEGVLESRVQAHPIHVAGCIEPGCRYQAAAVRPDERDAALWDHVAFVHLQSR